jgi:predicted AAA+ superfamily ATPase
MTYFPRSVTEYAFSEHVLQGRMAFLAGPRQIGKTTAAQRFLSQHQQPQTYYNWDTPTVKRRYAQNPLFFVEDLPPERPSSWVVLDEIHKVPKWKNLLKGYYDEWHEKVRFIVTGSARLEFFRKSGDSLVGRYFLFRMLPLGIREVASGEMKNCAIWSPEEDLRAIPSVGPQVSHAVDALLELTGFPEPFAVGTQSFCTRWREHHCSLILQEDVRDLTRIAHIRKLETLLYLLPERVGAPLSLHSLCQPLEAAHRSVQTWLEALQVVYVVFFIPPWQKRLARSVRKERKCYFWDWGMVEDPGRRFENFLAVQLQRAVASWNERGLGPYALHYLRTRDGQEVDFAVTTRKQVVFLVEAKAQDTSLSKSLPVFQEKVQAKWAFQVIRQPGACTQKGKGLYVIGADRFLSLLP